MLTLVSERERQAETCWNIPSAKVLKLVFESNGLGHGNTIWRMIKKCWNNENGICTFSNLRSTKGLFDDDVAA